LDACFAADALILEFRMPAGLPFCGVPRLQTIISWAAIADPAPAGESNLVALLVAGGKYRPAVDIAAPAAG